MSWLYRACVRPTLFRWDPEEIHDRTMDVLAWASRQPMAREALSSFFAAPYLPVKLWGLNFPNPLGVAAGLDKSASALPIWQSLGFGFTELGGVTWQPQDGNPKPRLFRLPSEEGLLNRMGFNNPGAEAMAEKLRSWRTEGLWPGHPVGINLGKSKATPLTEAASDYADSCRSLWPWADFFVINVSSPNTPGLTGLQEQDSLANILTTVQQVNREQAAASTTDKRPKPVLVKVSPDLTPEALDSILELATSGKMAGIIAVNTTQFRPGNGLRLDSRSNASAEGHPVPPPNSLYAQAGGLSGRPLKERSTEVIRYLYRKTGGSLPIIGVGGIFTGADAWEKITAGACLLQVYTGLVYQGPTLGPEIVMHLEEQLERIGLSDLAQAVGSNA